MKKYFALALLCCSVGAHAETLTVISFGGQAKDAQAKAFYRPFEKAGLGTIAPGEYGGEMAKIKAMSITGHADWDVVEVESPDLARGCEEGLFEKLDWSKIGNQADFIKPAVSECGVGMAVWSMVLAYDHKKFAKAPADWAAFWDVKTYPGKRALRKSAKFTLEIALLADGVKPYQLYSVLNTKEGVDRAFRKLDELKPNIQWWEAGAQPMQWLAAGDVVMTSSYNGRVTAAQKEGKDFGIAWKDSLFDLDSWAIVKGSDHKALGEKYIAFASKPENQKAFAEAIPYGPTHVKAPELIDPAILAGLPTAPQNMEVAAGIDTEFWLDNGEELQQRFNAWAAK
ncbi:ABC transporter substrate-binding protein [Pseudomonas sp. NPDC088444]|uniref:ABC transporter substrate-binding protein n=1 Tax=Pseudomonas sp. NPDC088444 TaxID=3364456 RepID=UPI00384ABD03